MITRDLGKAGITANSTWDITQAYEKNSIVFNMRDNTSYISRRDVPAGVDIADEYYWQPFAGLSIDDGSVTLDKLAPDTMDALGAAFPVKDSSGSVASFEDGADNVPVRDMKVNVEPYQNLNGYANPWVGGAGKNLLPITISSQTYHGITLTVNANGSVTVNGTASELTIFVLTSSLALADGTYVINGCPSGGGSSTYRLDVNDGSIGQDTGGSATFTVSGGTGITNVRLRIASGYTANNLVFWPMIRVAGQSNTFAPYENICPIYPANGKNLINFINSRTSNGITFSYDSITGGVTVSGTATANAYSDGTISATAVQNYFYAEAGTYYFTMRGYGSDRNTPRFYIQAWYDDNSSELIVNSQRDGVFTLTQSAWIYTRIQVISGVTLNGTIYPMIRHASITSDAYQPYKGFSTIRTGRNVLAPNLQNGTSVGVLYTLNPDGSVTAEGTSTSVSSGKDYISTATTRFRPPNGTYTLSGGNSDVGVRVNRYALDGTVIDRNTTYGTPIQIVIDDSISYIYCGVGYVTANKTVNTTIYPQLELGTTATAFEPYQGEQFFNVGDQDFYGGTLEVETGVLTVTSAMVDLGSLTYTGDATAPRFYSTQLQSSVKKPSTNDEMIGATSSLYREVPFTELYSTQKENGTMSIGATGTLSIIDKRYSVSDPNAYKTAVTGQTFVYPLASPLTYQLTPTQVKTLLGVNNIWTDSGTVEVQYRANIGMFVDENVPTYTQGNPYFSKTSGNSSIVRSSYYKYGHVCQLMLQLNTQSASLGDTMIGGTFTDLPLPAANGTASVVLVGGAVVGCRLTDVGAFTARLGGMNYTAPSGGGTSYVSIIYFTN